MNRFRKEPILELAVITVHSPQSPLTTLNFLKKIGIYRFLPDNNDSVEELKKKGYSKDFIEFWKEAQNATLSGQREGLRSFFEEKFSELKTSLDMLDFRVQKYFIIMNVAVLVVPILLSVTSIFTGTIDPLSLIMIVLCTVPLALAPPLIIPREMRLESPRPLVFLPLLLSLPLYLYFKEILVLIGASVISMVLTYIEEKRKIKEIIESGEILRRATQSSNIKFIGVTDPEQLLVKRVCGFVKALLVALYIQLAYMRSRDYFKATSKLMSIFREYLAALSKLRERALGNFVTGLIIVAVAAASFAFVYHTLNKVSSIGAHIPSYYGVRVLSRSELLALKEFFVELLITMSFSFSLISTTREGNPLYFAIYFAPLLALSYTVFEVALQVAPLWLKL